MEFAAHITATERWIESVVSFINTHQLNPEESKFMVAFFSSMDTQFIHYFRKNIKQISSFSGRNFHVFTPLITQDNLVSDEKWRNIRSTFQEAGIPLSAVPTFVFFHLAKTKDGSLEPRFFGAYEVQRFRNFPGLLKEVIEKAIAIKDGKRLATELEAVFQSPNIMPDDTVTSDFRSRIGAQLPRVRAFISHASRDKAFVRKLEKALSVEDGVKVWLDENEIRGGDEFQTAISKGLKASDFLLVVISKAAVRSTWVQHEISQYMGITEGRNIIPLLLTSGQRFPEPIDNLLRRLNYIDFSNEELWEQSVERLMLALDPKWEKGYI